MPRTENSCSSRTRLPGESRRGVTTKKERSRPVRRRAVTRAAARTAWTAPPRPPAPRAPPAARTPRAAVTRRQRADARRRAEIAAARRRAGRLDRLQPARADELASTARAPNGWLVDRASASRVVAPARAAARRRRAAPARPRARAPAEPQDLVEVRRHGALERVLERHHAAARGARGHRPHHVDRGRRGRQLVAVAREVQRRLVREGALGTEVCQRAHLGGHGGEHLARHRGRLLDALEVLARTVGVELPAARRRSPPRAAGAPRR